MHGLRPRLIMAGFAQKAVDGLQFRRLPLPQHDGEHHHHPNGEKLRFPRISW